MTKVVTMQGKDEFSLFPAVRPVQAVLDEIITSSHFKPDGIGHIEDVKYVQYRAENGYIIRVYNIIAE